MKDPLNSYVAITYSLNRSELKIKEKAQKSFSELNFETKFTKLDPFRYPLNVDARIWGASLLTQPDSCIEVVATDRENGKRIIIWFHYFETEKLSEEFMCQLNEICLGEGEHNSGALRKTYSGYDRFGNVVILMFHSVFLHEEKKKYHEILNLIQNQAPCWK